ncbi:ArsR/SmtB family transcription factor [Halococcoides cellulosivorans]|uniref:ArsR family transcriptional regulator n=1 Tax=Halococcoides cellulosivorans TaxID=1679096 RepID=A0A2R4X0R8_9EURY|nr:helix-turn-helix domain-containing protein [Halococcoides cellulosivorans]AWB27376.1 ArsR family transcriptional regulator [Halococcoides cellulosivorans]
MGRLLGITHRTETPPDGPRVLDLDSPDGEAAIDALASETARRLLSELYEQPATPPELRDAVETSLQNVHYHLDQLSEAGLVRDGGVSYSEKGTEMTVYEPAGEALLVVAGERSVRDRIRVLVTRMLGSVAVLTVATLAFAVGIDLFGVGGSADYGDGAPESGGDVGLQAQDTASQAASQTTIDPVLAFALGGLVIVLVVGVVWAVRSADVQIRT